MLPLAEVILGSSKIMTQFRIVIMNKGCYFALG
jgi:hypothetical protein